MLSYVGSSLRASAAAAVVALAAPAFADAPVMSLTVNAISGKNNFAKSIDIAPTSSSATDVGTYIGSQSGVATGGSNIWNCNYNFSAASGANFASQSGSLSFTNPSGLDMQFVVTMLLPTAAATEMSGLFAGSVSGLLFTSSSTGGVGAITPIAGAPLWRASTGDIEVASLLSDWTGATRSAPGATSIGSASFGGNTPSVPASSFGNSIAVTFSFMLTSGSTASFLTTLQGVGSPIPAPGAFALLAAAGLVAKRRRR